MSVVASILSIILATTDIFHRKTYPSWPQNPQNIRLPGHDAYLFGKTIPLVADTSYAISRLPDSLRTSGVSLGRKTGLAIKVIFFETQITYLNNSECEPNLTSLIVLVSLSIQIRRKSFWIWHSIVPEYSPFSG